MSTPELAHLNTRLNKKDLAIDYVLQDMGNVAELWSDAHVEMRIKLQRMIFPKGLSYDLELKKFGTPLLSNLFTLMKMTADNRESAQSKLMVTLEHSVYKLVVNEIVK